jgi:hypothetical protein
LVRENEFDASVAVATINSNRRMHVRVFYGWIVMFLEMIVPPDATNSNTWTCPWTGVQPPVGGLIDTLQEVGAIIFTDPEFMTVPRG